MLKTEIIGSVIELGLTAVTAAASFVEAKLIVDSAKMDIEEDNINYTQAAFAGLTSGAFVGLGVGASTLFVAKLVKLGMKLGAK